MGQSRASWEIDADQFPGTGSASDKLKFALKYAILAPSTHNTQPWRFQVVHRGIDLYADQSRGLKVIDPHSRQLVMSCGAALFNLRIALARFGYETKVRVMPFPDYPDLLAQVRVARAPNGPSDESVKLCAAITQRRTNRQAFIKRPVSEGIATQLSNAAAREGAQLTRLHPAAKAPLAALVATADRAQFRDKHFRRELATWLTPIGSRRGDGIPFVKKEYGSSVPLAITMRIRTFDIGAEFGAMEEALIKGAPALFVLSTPGDQAPDWLAAGQAMQAALLTACRHGVSASFLNQVLEVAPLRAQVAAMAPAGHHPQLVLRLGFGPPVAKATPRRPLADVLVE